MEWFFALVALMVVIALIRVQNAAKGSSDQARGSNEPIHYWIHNDPGMSDGGGGMSSAGMESNAGSFDGGSSDGGGGDSSGF